MEALLPRRTRDYAGILEREMRWLSRRKSSTRSSDKPRPIEAAISAVDCSSSRECGTKPGSSRVRAASASVIASTQWVTTRLLGLRSSAGSSSRAIITITLYALEPGTHNVMVFTSVLHGARHQS